MAIKTTFTVPAEGVGRRDYSQGTEFSTQPAAILGAWQDHYVAGATYTLDTIPFPYIYYDAIGFPQEDGTWGWTASTIPLHFYNIYVSTPANILVGGGLFRFASIDNFYSGILAERFGGIFGYTSVSLLFSKGVRTIPGSVYAPYFGAWGEEATFEIIFRVVGLATELTPAWAEY